ncbi:MAG: hypothetical protein WAR37_01590 [Candidatus Microsaccharimonas sp.]
MNLSDAIENYQPPATARALVANHPPLAIAGPTGSGKGTIASYLTQTANYSPIISDTTRAIRKHNDGYEVNGVHYWFVTEETAAKKLADGAYIEAKWVHGTTLYGTSVEAYQKVVDAGRTPLLEIDVQGIEDLMSEFSKLESILLLPPSFEVWQERLDGRGDMDAEQKIRRLHSALKEMNKPIENPRFYPVINTEVIDTAEIIKSGEYRTPAYQQQAFKVIDQLQAATKNFLAKYQ